MSFTGLLQRSKVGSRCVMHLELGCLATTGASSRFLHPGTHLRTREGTGEDQHGKPLDFASGGRGGMQSKYHGKGLDYRLTRRRRRRRRRRIRERVGVQWLGLSPGGLFVSFFHVYAHKTSLNGLLGRHGPSDGRRARPGCPWPIYYAWPMSDFISIFWKKSLPPGHSRV